MLTHYKNLILSFIRLSKEMGPLYGALVGIILFFVGAFLYTTENVALSGGISLGIMVLIHFGRKDGFYLKHFFGKQKYRMLLGEYLLLGLVFLISCIVNNHWQTLLIFLPALCFIPFMGSGVSSEQWQNFPVLFSKGSLVYKSGFRLYYPLWLLCLALLYLTSVLGKQDIFLTLVYAYVIIVSGFHALWEEMEERFRSIEL